jgi:hypothetical protein
MGPLIGSAAGFGIAWIAFLVLYPEAPDWDRFGFSYVISMIMFMGWKLEDAIREVKQ